MSANGAVLGRQMLGGWVRILGKKGRRAQPPLCFPGGLLSGAAVIAAPGAAGPSRRHRQRPLPGLQSECQRASEPGAQDGVQGWAAWIPPGPRAPPRAAGS